MPIHSARVTSRSVLRRVSLGLAGLLASAVVVTFVAAALFWAQLERGVPRLEGNVIAAGLGAPVVIARDAAGIPTITGRTRADVAYATGFLHAQERFFQMDELRRAAAGELGALFGAAGLAVDMQTRPHLFRARARTLVRRMSPAERAMLAAYVAGVNRGLADLRAAPFEYALLRQPPRPWAAEDSLLVVYAMYLDLQDPSPVLELDRARAAARLGPAMADLLYPTGSELDAAIDGSRLAPPRLPARLDAPAAARSDAEQLEPLVKGSNDWAVGGRLTATGAAMVANDMHLHTAMPNTWYRARFVVRPAPGAVAATDIVGVTLPGVFPMVVGSNGHVAWGFTDAYLDAHDAVIVEPVAGRPGWYRAPGGPRRIAVRRERICAGATCRPLAVRQTIWGPITGKLPDGREIADRWIAHDADAVRLAPMLALERARTVGEAVAVAHRLALPDENMVVGDSAGHIAWTIAGRVPARFGFDGRDAASWADGTRGWRGYLSPDRVPAIVDPPGSRVWTANNRVVGGAALRLLGEAGYDEGARARQIANRLFARDRFAERDMLAIQLDTTAIRARFWRGAMLRALGRRARDPRFAAMVPLVRGWNGRADIASAGYRLIRTYRADCIRDAYVGYLGQTDDGKASYAEASAEEAMRLLLRARPPGLVPPGARSWDAFEDAALDAVARSVADQAGGDATRFTWGGWIRAGVHHPLARAIPLLGRLTDPRDEPLPGDSGTPRAQYRGVGASERLVVSPGHEAHGLFHMPGGQSGAPLAPYYLAGHRDWLEGRPSALLPGRTRWVLTLQP